MRTLDTRYLSSALGAAESPCVSIYMPTERAYPESQQNGIRYKNLVRRAEEALSGSFPGRDTRELVGKLRGLQDDTDFWRDALDSVAVLASPGRFDAFKLPRKGAERVEVGDTFHVKPLIRHVQSADRFHVLGVSRTRMALFEGDRYEMHPVERPGLPLSQEEALGYESDESVRFGPQGGPTSRTVDTPLDVQRYLRVIDRAVTQVVSEPSGLPVVAFGNDENLAEFHAVAKNRHLIPGGVAGDWTKLSLHEIRERAWKVMEPFYLARLARVHEDFGTASSRGMATGDLKTAARAVVEGRVGTLLVDADKTLPGSIELATGAVRPAGPADAEPGDMLDDLAELGLRNGATVTVVPSDRMPTTTGLAAIFRF